MGYCCVYTSVCHLDVQAAVIAVNRIFDDLDRERTMDIEGQSALARSCSKEVSPLTAEQLQELVWLPAVFVLFGLILQRSQLRWRILLLLYLRCSRVQSVKASRRYRMLRGM